MSKETHKKTPWKPFLLGCFFGFWITLLLAGSGIIIGAKTLKFWMAKKEVISLKTPKIKTSDVLDYSATGIDIEGREISFNDFKGQPLFILVWHPECIHCLSTLMTVQYLYDALKDWAIPVLALTDGSTKEIEKVKIEFKLSIPMLKVKEELIKALCGNTVPCGLIVNSHGEIVYSHGGSANWGDTEIVQYFMNMIEKKSDLSDSSNLKHEDASSNTPHEDAQY